MTVRSLYFTAPEELELRERTLPEPDPGTVRVEAEVSAVSAGTERLLYYGETPETVSTDDQVSAFVEEFGYPMQYGYATVGTVDALGDEVDESWLGRRVFAYNPHESAFVVEPSELLVVPEEMASSHAALLANAETAVNFVLDGRPTLGERVAIFGGGVVGLLTAGILGSFPLETLTVVEPVERRREFARMLGAEAVPPGDLDALEASRPELVFELSGNPEALDDAMAIAGFDGRIVVGSWYGEKPATLEFGGRFHRNRLDIQSSQVSTIAPDLEGRWSRERRHETAWKWLRRLPVEELITHELPLEKASRAYELLESSPGDALQVLLRY